MNFRQSQTSLKSSQKGGGNQNATAQVKGHKRLAYQNKPQNDDLQKWITDRSDDTGNKTDDDFKHLSQQIKNEVDTEEQEQTVPADDDENKDSQ